MVRSRPSDADLQALLDRDLHRLLGLAMSMTGNRHDAEDLVQETLAKVIDKWGHVESSASPAAYVRRMLTNTYISQRRRFSSREVVSDEVVSGGLDSAPDRQNAHADRDLLRRLVTTLPRQQRAIVALRYYEDRSVREVAQIMGISEVAVRSACHKALSSLRERAPGSVAAC
ncbi:SigE family RNA polymerase sigma factor [Luteipulveratus flavus]|uniref:SigE family RNA polymerase sigma factor n=1 Tax=Luteipulveratus flavus TaxID=3031728 RepID=A0ABT6C6B2_9MICO|nr:SigE family RNA polymerase sigma factor [Luteipulveratus sp. YIM 133296]MDF8264468.1 SigE family RNA polymerase sigma factor [Luteipulveratus sp. YIM 133296]